MATIILTTGVPGSGKTYVRCARFLVDDFLINSNGVHISNFPVNIDKVSVFVAKKINRSRSFFSKFFRKKVTPEDIKKRIEIIPDDVLQLWRSGFSGPWDYFKGRDIKYAHIAIDEIHNFVNSRVDSSTLQKWDEFLGEIRHRGCTFEGLTQDISQVDQVLVGRASVRLELVPGEDLRDPFFKIRMSDWYELKAGFTGDFHKTVFVLEKRKTDNRWKTNHTFRFLITPDYYQFYNSYNASLQEKADGASDDNRAPLHEYQKRSRIGLLLWFIRRNFLTLFLRILIAIFLFWLCFCGGLNFFINKWLFVSNSAYKSNSLEKKDSAVTKSLSDKNLPLNQDSSSESEKPKTLDEVKYYEQQKKKFEDSFRPALFFDGKCWLQNGTRISIDYVFNDPETHGRFFQKKVIKIDFSERSFTLSDNTTITMY